MNDFGRIAMCGQVAQYSGAGTLQGPNLMPLVLRRLELRGYLASDHYARIGEFTRQVQEWLAVGRLRQHVSVGKELTQLHEAIKMLASGRNFGRCPRGSVLGPRRGMTGPLRLGTVGASADDSWAARAYLPGRRGETSGVGGSGRTAGATVALSPLGGRRAACRGGRQQGARRLGHWRRRVGRPADRALPGRAAIAQGLINAALAKPGGSRR